MVGYFLSFERIKHMFIINFFKFYLVTYCDPITLETTEIASNASGNVTDGSDIR